MKCLLDTHAFLWWMDDPGFLSEQARTTIKSGRNQIYMSAAVVWEMVIKKSLGKLDIPYQLDEALARNRFPVLPITVSHALAVQTLPPLHRDPFDRILIAQSLCEGLTLITRDPSIIKYPISFLVA